MKSFIDFFRNLNLHTKFQITIFFVSTVIQALIAFTSYYQGKALLEDKSFQLLRNLNNDKKKEIVEYFDILQGQIKSTSQDPTTLEAMRNFSQAYNQINDEFPASQTTKMLMESQEYYENIFIKDLEYYSLNDYQFDEFVITDSRPSLILQYFYIYHNPNPKGFKDKLDTLPKNEYEISYDKVHQKYHAAFRNFKNNYELQNIFLIDTKGNLVYSVNKEADFARNFSSGIFKNSNAGRLYRQTLNLKKDAEQQVIFIDYEHYEPSYFQPYSFMATPIYDKGKKIGVLMFQLFNKKIDKIVSNNLKWEEEGLSTSGEVNIIGQDFLTRTNTRSILSNPLDYYQKLKAADVDSFTINRIQRLETTILLRKSNSPAVINALKGNSGESITTDYLGKDVLDVYTPINIMGVRWAMVTEIDAEEIFASVYAFRNQLIQISILIFALQTIFGFILARGLSRPMIKIRNDITMLSEGKLPKPVSKLYKDELGEINKSLNTLINKFKGLSNFAESVGKGKYDYDLKADDEDDILTLSLLRMRDNLQEVSKDEGVRNWINNGRALFNEILREKSDNLKDLSESLIMNFVKYLDASQGAIFLINEEGEYLEMESSYAYDRLKYIDKKIYKGEGLVGQVLQEGNTLFITDIPQQYSEIASGLGEAPPSCVLLVPLKFENKPYGVVEIASFKVLIDYEIDFVEMIAENIAGTIENVKSSEETRKLLENSQANTERLVEQDREMKENLKKLEQTQQEMSRREKQLEKSNTKMKSNEEILKKAFEKMREQESQLKENIKQQEKQEAEMRSNLIELEKTKVEMQEKQTELEASKATLEKQNEKMEGRNVVLRKAFAKMRKQEKELQKSLEAQRLLEEEMKYSVNLMQKEKEEILDENIVLQKTIQSLEEQIEKLQGGSS